MKVVLQFVILFALLTFGATLAFACDCDSQSQRQRFRAANSVFVGEVLDFKVRPEIEAETETNEDLKNFPYQVTFRVEKQWKGKRQSKISAFAAFDNPGFCGDLELKIGKRFLIYAPRDYGQLIVYRDCGPNREAEYVKDEIKNLSNFFFRTSAFFYPFPKF